MLRSPPSDLSDRDLAPGDVEAAADLVVRCDTTYEEWAGPWTAPSHEREVERWVNLLARPDHWARGAFNDARRLVGVVGWRQAVDEQKGEIPGVAHVVAVFTDPDRWGQGIAAHLLTLGETEMARRQYRVARLWTPRDAPARAFYLKEGWTLDGRAKWEPDFDLDLVGYEKPVAL